MWLMEEVGELSAALRKGDHEEQTLEFADVLAWLATIANVAGVDLTEAVMRKYGSGCPGCGRFVCTCPDAGEAMRAIADCRLQIVDCRLKAANYQFAIFNLVILIASMTLPSAAVAQQIELPEIVAVRVGLADRYKVGLWTQVEITLRGGGEAMRCLCRARRRRRAQPRVHAA